jgi:uncharacterized protein YegP (UPF0339 family)
LRCPILWAARRCIKPTHAPSLVLSPTTTDYERETAKNGQPFFVLQAANGELVGWSERYSSASAMESIASVKPNAPTATVDDLTKVAVE